MPRTVGETDDFGIIKANYGRFGPYIQYGKKYVSLLTFAFFLAIPNVGAKTTIKDLNFAVIEGFDDAFSVEFLFATATFKYTYRAPLRRIGQEYQRT
jgi:hypothetical protein